MSLPRSARRSRLRDDRLVAIVPQLGTFVTLISDEAIADAAFVREALECSAIRLATERATPAQLEELQANLAAQGAPSRRATSTRSTRSTPRFTAASAS